MSSPAAVASRVSVDLGLRARRDLVARQIESGARRLWSVKDPVALKYYQLGEEEYAVLTMLQQRMSFEDLFAEFHRRFQPRRISASALQAYLWQLWSMGLLTTEGRGDGQRWWQQSQRIRRSGRLQSLFNVLAIRLPGFQPSRFLNWLGPRAGWLFSRPMVVAATLLLVMVLLLIGVNWGAVQNRLPDARAFFQGSNVALLFAALAVSRCLHELGHALVCRRFGAECHEMGVMFLVGTPCLYCDVSDAWLIPRRWQRMAVSAAGMYVDLVVAAGCALIWFLTEPGLLNLLCLNLFVVNSVSTLVFNLNPLLRFDGYYLLVDLLGIPNLRDSSRREVSGRLAAICLGLPRRNVPTEDSREQAILVVYGVASMVYRVMIVAAILWFVHSVLKQYRAEVLIVPLAMLTLSSLLIPPVAAAIHFMASSETRARVKRGRLAVSAGVLLAITGAVIWVPLPHRITVPFVVEPEGAVHLFVPADGILSEVAQASGPIQLGTRIAVIQNDQLEMELADLLTQSELARAHYLNLEQLSVDDQKALEELPIAREQMMEIQTLVSRKRRELRALQIEAPRNGDLIPAPIRGASLTRNLANGRGRHMLDPSRVGVRVDRETWLASIGRTDMIDPILLVDESMVQFLKPGLRVELQLREAAWESIEAVVEEIALLDLVQIPVELIQRAEIPVRMTANGRTIPVSTVYEVRVRVLGEFPPGATIHGTGRARIHAAPRSLARRLHRYAQRTFSFVR